MFLVAFTHYWLYHLLKCIANRISIAATLNKTEAELRQKVHRITKAARHRATAAELGEAREQERRRAGAALGVADAGVVDEEEFGLLSTDTAGGAANAELGAQSLSMASFGTDAANAEEGRATVSPAPVPNDAPGLGDGDDNFSQTLDYARGTGAYGAEAVY